MGLGLSIPFDFTIRLFGLILSNNRLFGIMGVVIILVDSIGVVRHTALLRLSFL